MTRILYVYPGPVPPEGNPAKDKFFHLSKYFAGDILLPVWNKTEKYQHLLQAGNFRYHITYSTRFPGPLRFLWEMGFYIFRGLDVYWRKNKYDVVIPYGTNRTGIAAYLLAKLTGAKLILEIPGTPRKAFICTDKDPTFSDRLKNRLSRILLVYFLNRAGNTKLIYPKQLDGIAGIRPGAKISICHSFVPIHYISPSDQDDKYLLLMGHPWFLKGADVLIKAFLEVADEFPEHRLKIVGFCPDRTPFEALANGHPRIEFLKPVFHDEAIQLISKCTAYVVASRTEGFPRVLYEAMAAKKPFIASAIDGIPYYVREGKTGLLFQSEDVAELAEKIRVLLRDPELRRRLGEQGRLFAETELSEHAYLTKFSAMVHSTLQD